jgi:Flp pilus assembly protein TadD
MGRYDEAIAIYRRILEDDPGDADARHELVYATFAKGDYRETIALAEEALARGGPAAAGMYVFLGGSHGLLGDWARAEAVLRQGLAQWPEHDALRFNLALSLAAQGRLEPAIAGFEACLRESPYLPVTWRALGDVLYEAGARGRAVAAYARSLTLEKGTERSREVAQRLWEMVLQGAPSPSEVAESSARSARVRIPRGPARSPEADSPIETIAISMVGALRHTESWDESSDASFFAYALDGILKVVSTIHSPKERGSFWGPFVLSYFDEMRAAGHMEALAYDIRSAAGDPDAGRWAEDNAARMRRYREHSARWVVDWARVAADR